MVVYQIVDNQQELPYTCGIAHGVCKWKKKKIRDKKPEITKKKKKSFVDGLAGGVISGPPQKFNFASFVL